MEDQDHEFSKSFPEELKWSEDEWEDMPESEFLDYKVFNRGSEASAWSKGQPCSTVFLDELLHNLCMWNVQLVLSMGAYRNLDTVLDEDTKAVVEHIYGAMDECTRLRLHPELFIAEEVRIQFLAQVASISENIMVQLSKVTQKMDSLALVARRDRTLPRPVRVRKVGGIYYRIRNPIRMDPEGFHHTKIDRKVWNKWMENRTRPEIGIEQRIPDTGHRMLRRMQYMYTCIETNFKKTGRILGKPKDTSFLARATGEDYSTLLTPQTHPHVNVPLNFHSDIFSQVDYNGAVKLETISIACACFQQRELMPERTGVVCEVVHRN